VRSERPRLLRIAVACSIVALGFWVVRITAGESVAVTVGAVAFTIAALGLLAASQRE
jgi:hypothetical protein